MRKNGDYVSNMIELAGGKYVPEDTGESDNALSTMNMQMEEFMPKQKMRTISSITVLSTVNFLVLMNCWQKVIFWQILRQ